MYKISGTEETLISSDCNPETSKGPTNSSDLYILNGKLYYNSGQKRIGHAPENWFPLQTSENRAPFFGEFATENYIHFPGWIHLLLKKYQIPLIGFL